MIPVTIIKDTECSGLYKVKNSTDKTLGIYSYVPGRITLCYVGYPDLLKVNRKYKSIESMLERNGWQLVEDSET
mgnify:CR=1 FL=1